ncbi:MAG: diaminopimelate epimerase [Eubacteriales bacterium]|mgnify:FL=1|jgi:diaminopimelate epimerase|nr:diaminopimelate epimerase [Eubacteriales bacterium]MDD3536866.1 diaminopimelate epimerase [Eubacteriales bacterium]NLV70599.1 diaminopimelate epimerase [Clostridiales bacterium]HPF19154.1 diaminopimelate epimerase [Bacillota bacterium]
MEVHKYHALGNDYLVYDPKFNPMELNEERIKLICDRNFGVGSDGILYGPEFRDGKPVVRIFNPDGGEAEKSGSGVRIFSKYLKDAGYVTEQKFTLITLGGEVLVEFLNESGDYLKVLMGKTTYRSVEIPVAGPDRMVIDEPMEFNGNTYKVTCVSIGNPHCVIPMEEISKELACELGPHVEHSKNFPNRINMQLLEVLDRSNIRIEIYERGAGYTLASGTSSCASASAAYKLGLVDRNVTVHMPGGQLKIEILPDESVFMTGHVHRVGVTRFSEEFTEDLAGL